MWLLNDLFASTAVHAGERLSVIAMKQLGEIGDALDSYSMKPSLVE